MGKRHGFVCVPLVVFTRWQALIWDNHHQPIKMFQCLRQSCWVQNKRLPVFILLQCFSSSPFIALRPVPAPVSQPAYKSRPDFVPRRRFHLCIDAEWHRHPPHTHTPPPYHQHHLYLPHTPPACCRMLTPKGQRLKYLSLPFIPAPDEFPDHLSVYDALGWLQGLFMSFSLLVIISAAQWLTVMGWNKNFQLIPETPAPG